MGKYIIEVGDAYVRHALGRKLIIPVIINNDTEYWVNTNIQLTPYTEPDTEKVRADAYNDGYEAGREAEKVRQPDIEQVRKEAYEQGQKDLRESCVPKDEEAYGFGYNEGFQCGLDLTWDAVRKIENLSEAEKFEIFGEYDMFHIMRHYNAIEAIEKIRQHEQEKEQSFTTEEVMRQYLSTFCKGRSCIGCPLNTPDFTCGRGKHFLHDCVSDEEIRRAYAAVLAKMKES